MHYDYVAISDEELPPAADPLFQHLLSTYASETNKTASMWHAVPADLLDYRPHEKTNTIRAIMVHQLLSERRFFGEFLGTSEPEANEVLPAGAAPSVDAYREQYIALARRRLPQFAAAPLAWWLEERPFFDSLQRQRIWIFWRRLLHTCHHRTQIQTWLRLAGAVVPPIYGPSGDVQWHGADPTYTVAAAGRKA